MTESRYALPLFSFMATAAMLTAAAAQSPVPAVVKAEAGKPVMIGYYSFVRNDCSGGATPKIHVTIEPKHGLLIAKPATVSTKKLQKCGTVKAPAIVIAYKANAGFTGSEPLSFDIVNSDTGKAQPVLVTVVVTAPNTSL